MKKHVLSLLSLALLTGSLTVPTLKTEKANAFFVNKVAYAEYVSKENAPTIDGVRDEVWTSSGIQTGTTYSDNAQHYASGFVDILWNETGLYFFATVTDDTVNASDLCNFWVSETYYRLPEANVVYPDVDGSYYLCLNKAAENAFYSPDNFEDQELIFPYTAAATVTETGYLVEVYVPLLGEKDLTIGNSIGFDVSIDNYLAEGEGRDGYTNWNGNDVDWYWENPTALGEVKLVDEEESNGKAPTPTPAPDNNSSTATPDDNSSVTEKNSSIDNTSTDSETESSSCLSSITLAPVATTLLIGLSLFAKKKNNK